MGVSLQGWKVVSVAIEERLKEVRRRWTQGARSYYEIYVEVDIGDVCSPRVVNEV